MLHYIYMYLLYGFIITVVAYVYRTFATNNWETVRAPNWIQLTVTVFVWPIALFFLVLDTISYLIKYFRKE